MSASIALSAAATAQALAAKAKANEAARLACESLVRGYQHDSASVEAMRDYAACIGRLYPMPAGADQVLLIKFVIAWVIGGMIVGMIWAWSAYPWNSWLEKTGIGFIAGICASLILFLVGAGLFYGIGYLIS